MLYKQNIKFISASAGSGKTTTLIKELKDLLANNEPKNIICITFTIAAANEIKERINKELAIDLNSLFVGTMHSFFTRILRENSYKLAISSDFKIIDENEAIYIKETIFKKTYLNYYSNEAYKFIYSIYSYDRFKDIIFKLFNKAYLINNKLKTKDEYVKDEFYYLETYFENILESFTKNIEAVKNAVLFNIEDNFAKHLKEVYAKLKEANTYIDKYYSQKSFDNIISFVNYIENLSIDFNLKFRPSKDAWVNIKEPETYKKALSKLRDLIKQLIEEKEIFEYNFIEKAGLSLSLFVDFYKAFYTEYKNIKYNLNVLDFSDIELFAYDLIINNPDLLKDYKNKFKYILVDEFQDTNHIQKEIIFSLADNLFLVGDAKQSIYGFRSADLRVFNNIAKEVENINLNYNHRSSIAIINFVNHISQKIFNEYVDKKMSYHCDFIDMETKTNNLGILKIFDTKSNDYLLELELVYKLITLSLNNNYDYKDIYILLRNNKDLPIFYRYLLDNNIPATIYGEVGLNDIIYFLSNIFKGIFNPCNNYYFIHLLNLPIFYINEKYLFALKEASYYDLILNYDVLSNNKKLDEDTLNSINNIKVFFNNLSLLEGSSLSEIFSFIFNELKLNSTIKTLFNYYEDDIEQYVYNNSVKYNKFTEFIKIFENQNISTQLDNNLNTVKLLTNHKAKGLDSKIVILPRIDFSKHSNDELVISYDGDLGIKLPIDYTPTWKKTAKFNSILKDEEARDVAEARRLLYVAITRAKDNLYLIGNFSKKNKNKDLNNTYKWNDLIASLNLNIEDASVFKNKLDTKNENVLSRKIYKVDFKINELNNINKGIKLNISQIKDFTYCPYLFLRNTICDTIKYKYSDKNMHGKGTIIHNFLESYNKKDFNFSKFDTISKNILISFVESKVAESIFSSNNYLNEHSFKYNFDNNLIIGRIDRINIYENKISLFEYKTSIDLTDTATFNSYLAQVYFYAYYLSIEYKNYELEAFLIDVKNIKEYRVDLNIDINNFILKTIESINKFISKENFTIKDLSCSTCKVDDLCNKFKG